MRIYLVEVESLIGSGDWLGSLNKAVSVLGLLKIDIPKPEIVNESHIVKEFGSLKTLIGDRDPECFYKLNLMEDKVLISAMEILTLILPASFIAAPPLFPIIASKMASLSIRHGNSPMSALGYANIGIVLCSLGDTSLGYRYGQLGIKLLDLPGADAYKTRTINNVNVFLIHWQEHLKNTIKPLLNAFDTGLETGDLVFAGYSINAHNYHLLFTGVKLSV